MYDYPHCPIVSDSRCKCNASRANNTQNYKPGPGLPKDIIYKIRPIYIKMKNLKMKNYLKKKIIYMFLGKFKYIVVYLNVCYVTLIRHYGF